MPFNRVHAEETQPEVLSGFDFPGLAARFAPVGRVRELYRRVRQSPEGFRLEKLLAEMRIDLRVYAGDQSRIPSSGPVVVVANHPYGMLDGAILAVLLTRVRPDVKILTNLLLGDVPELQQHCIFLDSDRPDHCLGANRRALRRAVAHLHQGGLLVVFPSDDVSHWQMPAAEIADPEWSDTAARLIRKTGASALPIYLCGHFQFLSMVSGKLRSAFLLQEFLQQEGKPVEVRVGSPIAADSLSSLADDREATEYLRWRTYLLAKRSKAEVSWPTVLRTKLANKNQEPIAEAVQPELLAAEIATLPTSNRLAENGAFSVYLTSAASTPQLLREVGRLREITFRRAGEGTGKSLDLDLYDEYYSHVLLWNETKRELVGAYRAGNTAEIIAEYGISGLYTSTLFRYDKRIFQKLGPAWELGRSFVRPEYQRQYAPLLLLWKGIARMIAMRPEIPVLFGAVSISNDYNDASREMIYRFFEDRMRNDVLSGMIEPRRPFRPAGLRRWDCRSMSRALHDLDELSEPITDVETDGKGLPILLRQYAKIGGKLLGFNVDRKFSNVLDGLVVVDLRQTEPAVLERYMGRESAAAFRKIHASTPVQ